MKAAEDHSVRLRMNNDGLARAAVWGIGSFSSSTMKIEMLS
jgi:hypothetical protein